MSVPPEVVTMAGRQSAPLDRLRQPEYTGENRCWPCTIANVAIAAVGTGTVALAAAYGGAGLPVVAGLAAVAFGVAVAAIYLRGYLVPYTPTLTKRYFPDRLLRAFDKHPAGTDAGGSDLDREALLVRGGAVKECVDVDDLCLTDEFRTGWRERILRVRDRDAEDTRADLAEMLGADPAALTLRRLGDAFVARLDDRRVGQWESEAAYVADIAAAGELEGRIDGWERLPVGERGELLNRLRVFLESCPSCDGPVTPEAEVIESCCRSIDVVAVSCGDCGTRLFEAERPEPG